MCQCPHGLIPHFYQSEIFTYEIYSPVSMPSRAYTSFLRWKSTVAITIADLCQCPHGLIPHFYRMSIMKTLQMSSQVSMPSRAYTSFLQYPFKNLGFMRFPEPVFAGICQNILTVTVFRAC